LGLANQGAQVTFHTWYTAELARRIEIPQDEVRRRLMTLHIHEKAPNRWPVEALALLRAQSKGQAICRMCWTTSDIEGKCPGKHKIQTRMVYLPHPEGFDPFEAVPQRKGERG